MAQVERGVPLVERIIERLEPHVSVRGANASALDALESKLMVELPPTLRRGGPHGADGDGGAEAFASASRHGMTPAMSSEAAPRESRVSDAAGLPIGPCPACEREVLAHRRPEGDGFACVHCDGILRQVYLVDESELSELGYDAWDPLASGCGTGCGSGGCGVRR